MVHLDIKPNSPLNIASANEPGERYCRLTITITHCDRWIKSHLSQCVTATIGPTIASKWYLIYTLLHFSVMIQGKKKKVGSMRYGAAGAHH